MSIMVSVRGEHLFPSNKPSRGGQPLVNRKEYKMYRQYENPFTLEDALEEARKRLAEDPMNEDLAFDVHELEERVNFAWQDDEYDSDFDY